MIPFCGWLFLPAAGTRSAGNTSAAGVAGVACISQSFHIDAVAPTRPFWTSTTFV